MLNAMIRVMNLLEISVYFGLKVLKQFSCSAHLGMKLILLINIKMPTIVGILTFISRMNNSESC